VLNYGSRLSTQVDLTKMEAGGLDAVFFSIYVGQPANGQGQDSAGYARAYATDTAKFNSVHRLAEQIAPTRIGIAYTADDARRLFKEGKKIAFMGVENGYGIGTDITRVKEFYDRGARYMSLAHNNPSQLSDSNTGEGDGFWEWHGLSPLGKQVIGEMNKWGIMIDISHPSRESMAQSLELTKAPIIASHSGVRAICDVSRNLADDQLKALAKNGGVIQVVAFRSYVKCDPKGDAARNKALADLRTEFGITAPAGRGGGAGRGAGAGAAGGAAGAAGGAAGGRGGAAGAAGGAGRAGGGAAGAGGGAAGGGAGRGATPGAADACGAATPGAGRGAGGGGAGGGGRGGANAAVDSQLSAMPATRRADYEKRQAAIMAQYPQQATANVKDYVDHIDYAVKMMGIDHVGISSDFDGGGGLEGYNCALEAINVTKELVRRGYSEEQIGKIWSGNLLRVLGEVEKVAKKIQSGK